jgi:hypothetical protein
MPYVGLQSMLDPGAPHGLHYHMKSAQFDALSDAAIDVIVDGAAAMASPLSAIHLHQLGGAVARVREDATAYSGRAAGFTLNIIAAWTDTTESAAHVGWARTLFDAASAHGNGAVYPNFLGDEGQDRVRAAFGAKYDRLVAIKRRYDPGNVLRYNQNIRP